MKKTYLAPQVEVVNVDLIGSVMETIGIVTGSKETGWDAAAKEQFDDASFWDEDEVEEENTALQSKNIWE